MSSSNLVADDQAATVEGTDTALEGDYDVVELKDIPAILDKLESEVVDNWNEVYCEQNTLVFQIADLCHKVR